MKKILPFLFCFFLFKGHSQHIKKHNLNFLITADLSNRINTKLYPKPVSDVDLISEFIDKYYPNIYNIGRRKIGQKDHFSICFTNNEVLSKVKVNSQKLNIDLGNFKDLARIKYLTNKSDQKFSSDVSSFKKELKSLFSQARKTSTGADLIQFFKYNINSSNIKNNGVIKKLGSFSKEEINDNIVVLFTDGYLEAGLYGNDNCLGKKCYYLNSTIINKFRCEFKKSGSSNLKDFFKKSGYGIVPVNNPTLKKVNIYVAEIYDRSLSKTTGSATVMPNDYEILKVFWEDWLQQSGFKSFSINRKAPSTDVFYNSLKSYVEEVIKS